ncbi:MAG: hypothetical protein ACRD5H_17435, partial [Nitrososphaerales archaeon]
MLVFAELRNLDDRGKVIKKTKDAGWRVEISYDQGDPKIIFFDVDKIDAEQLQTYLRRSRRIRTVREIPQLTPEQVKEKHHLLRPTLWEVVGLVYITILVSLGIYYTTTDGFGSFEFSLDKASANGRGPILLA